MIIIMIKNTQQKKNRPIASGKINFDRAKKIFYLLLIVNLINFYNHDLKLILTFCLYFH